MEPERLWMKEFVKEMSFKSGVKGRGSDRMRANMVTEIRRMRWTGRSVNSWRNEEGSWFYRWGDAHMWKSGWWIPPSQNASVDGASTISSSRWIPVNDSPHTTNECLYMARSSMDVPEKKSAVVGDLRINVAGDVLGPCKLKTWTA